MNNQLKPAIAIDFKENRIRIHKPTLRLIGDTEYIILLINPEEHIMAIKPSDSSDKYAHRIRKVFFEGGHSFELHSGMLNNKLLSLCDYWEKTKIYRIYGEYVPSEKIVIFHMRDYEQDSENGMCDYD